MAIRDSGIAAEDVLDSNARQAVNSTMPTPHSVEGRHYATGEWVTIHHDAVRIRRVEAIPQPAGARERWIAPALFDPQVNGFGGIDFQQDDLTGDHLLTATRALRAAGCTRWLLTLITDDWEKLLARLRQLRALRDASPELRRAIVGWHVEGPFLSAEPGFRGAHDSSVMRDPVPGDMLRLREAAGEEPLLVTLAPERAGALEAIQEARKLGITISLGHTDAPAATLRAAVNAGVGAFTHLANGCPRQLDRHDNILWRVLEIPNLTVSLIPDRIHVSPALFRLIHQLKPAGSIFYTTDAMSAAGMPPGRYPLGRLEVEVGADQVVRQPGQTNFAGSALRPIDGVLRAAEMLGRSWRDVWDRSSTLPARLMGLDSGLQPGFPADLCVMEFDPANQLRELQIITSGS